MRLILSLLALFCLMSCGKDHHHTKTVTKHIENPYDDSNLSDEVDKLQQELSDLTLNNLSSIVLDIDSLNLQLEELSSDVELTESNLKEELETLNTEIEVLQTLANDQQAQLTSLLTNENIVSFIDPCGNGTGFDEVILKTSSGKFVAYFEDGGKRFLTVLETNTSYRTTDQQSCHFTLNSSGQLLW